MKKNLLLFSLLALATMPLAARTLSPAEALSRATGTTAQRGFRAPAKAEPVMTVGTEQNPALYVFNQTDNGFIIVSADDVAAPVIGYSDNGTFDPDNIPANMQWWLDNCRQQIETASTLGVGIYTSPLRTTRAAVEPLVATRWNQSAPYNNDCPVVNGSRSVTGCVATAMAQLMKYHNWPKKANSNASFTNSTTNTTADFSNYEFDWDNMLDKYVSGSYTTAQASAVSMLMKACGYSVDMQYSPSASGAIAVYVSRALASNFGYDYGLYNAVRDLYTNPEWEDLIYEELSASRPVLYSGSGTDGGHCFICDGYQGDGYFHFNWGWGGVSDGYFLFSVLAPGVQGIGGNTSGFNNGQEALIGAKPAGATQSPKDYAFGLRYMMSASYSGTTLTLSGYFLNYSAFDISNPTLCVRVCDENDNYIKTIDYTSATSFPVASMFQSIQIQRIPSNLTTGTYHVYPAIRIGSKEYLFRTMSNQLGYALLTVNGSNVTVSVPTAGDLQLNNLKADTELYVGSYFKLSGVAKFTGSESVSAYLDVLLLNSSGSSIVGYGDGLTQDFTPEGEPFEYVGSWFTNTNGASISPTPGTYYIAFAYVQGNSYQILDAIPVTVNAKSTTNTVTISGAAVANSTAVDPMNIEMSANVKCTAGVVYGDVLFAIFNKTNQNVGQWSSSYMLSAGQSETVKVIATLPDAKPGETYYMGVFKPTAGSYQQQGNTISFKISSTTTGIEDAVADRGTEVSVSPNPADDYTVVTADTAIVRVDVASVSGSAVNVPVCIEGAAARLDVTSLAPGLYVARIATEAGVRSVKIIKK